ncbi:uncharacterized protein LOC131162870 [Malania oleifera]|uniref:uncharacterized protein LOC131162870 n=1 Tax=Malania oleifera TaxID=397392 RepID=UPI0025AE11F1|nr:uncharacterized protein LOC131162870 [Malania oleifera]
MKLFDRFRRVLMRFIFSSSSSLPSHHQGSSSKGTRPSSCDVGSSPDPPKTSCSSYYSSNSHYSEAIADCIEFFNKSSSSQDGVLDA